MPVSGLVLTLAPGDEARRAVTRALELDERVTLGEPAGGRLPVVTEAESLDESEALFRHLAALEGVLQAQLAFCDFSDIDIDREREADRGSS